MSKASIEQWNQAAGAYAKEQEQSVFSDMNKAVVKERFTSLSGEEVLDLGCGYGCYTDYFRSIGGEVIGVDGSPAMIEIAKEKYPDSAFAIADITGRLPFEDEAFDIVFCNQVLMDIDPVGPVFAECRRVLKPGGIFYYSIVHPAFFTGEWMTDEKTGRAGKMVTSYITSSICENRFWGMPTSRSLTKSRGRMTIFRCSSSRNIEKWEKCFRELLRKNRKEKFPKIVVL